MYQIVLIDQLIYVSGSIDKSMICVSGSIDKSMICGSDGIE